MTTENITTTDEAQNGNNKPNFYAKVRHGFGKKASYEQIGAAWVTEKGAIYVSPTRNCITNRRKECMEITLEFILIDRLVCNWL